MKPKVFLVLIGIAILALVVIAGYKKSKQDDNPVTKTFLEYVKTDFDNPRDFIEITESDKKDTLKAAHIYHTLCAADSIAWILSDQQIQTLHYLQHEFEGDSTIIVQHELKVRMRGEDGEKYIKKFYVTEENGEFHVGDENAWINEMPPKYIEAIQFMEETTPTIDLLKKVLIEEKTEKVW